MSVCVCVCSDYETVQDVHACSRSRSPAGVWGEVLLLAEMSLTVQAVSRCQHLHILT